MTMTVYIYIYTCMYVTIITTQISTKASHNVEYTFQAGYMYELSWC